MKNRRSFRLRDATLVLAFVFSGLAEGTAWAQDGPGGQPEIMAPMGSQVHSAKAKVVSTTLSVTFGEKTLNFSAADLAAMPHEMAVVTNGHTKASETYSGVPVSAILAKLGAPFEKANEHTLLRTCLIAEGTDGYKVLLSTYETLSAIRGTSVLVADTLDGKPLNQDGAFKLVVPGDSRPQRWVQNLKLITFKTID